PKLQLPKPWQTTNAPTATGPAPRKTTSGPSSIPCWTSDSANLRSPHLAQEVACKKNGLMKTTSGLGIAIAGMSAMVAVAAYGQMGAAGSSNRAEAVVDAMGTLRVPDTVAASQGQGSKELHVVYA